MREFIIEVFKFWRLHRRDLNKCQIKLLFDNESVCDSKASQWNLLCYKCGVFWVSFFSRCRCWCVFFLETRKVQWKISNWLKKKNFSFLMLSLFLRNLFKIHGNFWQFPLITSLKMLKRNGFHLFFSMFFWCCFCN